MTDSKSQEDTSSAVYPNRAFTFRDFDLYTKGTMEQVTNFIQSQKTSKHLEEILALVAKQKEQIQMELVKESIAMLVEVKGYAFGPIGFKEKIRRTCVTGGELTVHMSTYDPKNPKGVCRLYVLDKQQDHSWVKDLKYTRGPQDRQPTREDVGQPIAEDWGRASELCPFEVLTHTSVPIYFSKTTEPPAIGFKGKAIVSRVHGDHPVIDLCVKEDGVYNGDKFFCSLQVWGNWDYHILKP